MSKKGMEKADDRKKCSKSRHNKADVKNCTGTSSKLEFISNYIINKTISIKF